MILECRGSWREASISFYSDLLTHCISVAVAHTAAPAHPGMHDEKTKSAKVQWKNGPRNRLYTASGDTHTQERGDKMIKARRYRADITVNNSRLMCAETPNLISLPSNETQFVRRWVSPNQTPNKIHSAPVFIKVLFVFLHHWTHFDDRGACEQIKNSASVCRILRYLAVRLQITTNWQQQFLFPGD